MNILRTLLMLFYAPARAFRIVRDDAPLVPAAILALVAQCLYSFYVQAPQLLYMRDESFTRVSGATLSFGVVFGSALELLFIAVVFVPAVIFIANLFERRGSFRLVLQQEYASVASCVFMAWAAASLLALPLAAVSRLSGFEALALESQRAAEELQRNMRAGADPASVDQRAAFGILGNMLLVALLSPVMLLAGWATIAVREIFRFSWWRAATVVIGSGILMVPAAAVLLPLFNILSGSLFLIFFIAILLRGYITELTRSQRARASFRQNLEAATLNPADASAHYNLGLIHLDRKEYADARTRFLRAVEIDAEELDAHYQLGRVSRLEGKYPEAIGHFGEVVTRDQTHAQHEVWREIGATYLVAGQHEDAVDALERFLEHRTSDPEGLYLMGRALAATGRRREATELMERCIEAVRSAPAYKYRTDKRWLNEAQAFLRSQA